MTSTSLPSTEGAPASPTDIDAAVDTAVDAAVLTALAQADSAIGTRDGKGAVSALGQALVSSTTDAAVAMVTARLEILAGVGVESDAVTSLLARAAERTSDQALEARILRARATLHEKAGHNEAALQVLQRLQRLVVEPHERGALCEHMGDLATALGMQQQALIHLQAAFRADRTRTTATKKAIAIYFDLGREEQAKQLLDVLHGQLEAGTPDVGAIKELVDGYVKASEALIVQPQHHKTVHDAAQRIARLAPDNARGRSLAAELEAFPTSWKDHVRRLRDAALDARDKKDAARRYLAIAQIYATYAKGDAQIEQNIEKCLLLAPGYRPAVKFLEQLYREDGRLNDLIDRVKRLADGVRATDVAVDLWLFVAVLLAERGASPDELAFAYDKVRTLDPRNVAAIHALTELYLEHSRYDKAVVVMEAFVKESADQQAKAQTLRQLARLYELEIQDLDKAAQRLEQVRELTGDDDDIVLGQLADLYDRKEDHTRLAPVLEQRARLAKKKNDTATELPLLERLLALYQGPLDADEKAFTVGRRLFSLQPRGPLEDDLVRLAEKLGRGADLGQALTEAASRMGPTGEGRRLRLRAAQVFMGVGDRKRARALIDALLEHDPRDKDATALIDTLLAKDASPEEHTAILEGRLRLQTEPVERSQTLTALADTNARVRNLDEAVALYGQALDADPQNRSAHDKLEALLRQNERFAELWQALERRIRTEDDSGDTDAADAARLRIAKLAEERLNRHGDATAIYLRLYQKLDDSVAHDDARRTELVRALERALKADLATVDIATLLRPHYAAVGAWRSHVEMLALLRGAAAEPSRRAVLSQEMVLVFEAQLKSPREAFDAAAEVLLDEPSSAEALDELVRLADLAQAHARFAEVVGEAADKLDDGPPKQALLAKRAGLLQGVLGDQVAAIEAHQTILRTQPDNVASLDALIDLYEQRESYKDLRPILEKRLDITSGDDVAAIAGKLGLLLAQRFDPGEARPHLERALSGPRPVGGEVRAQVLKELTTFLRRSVSQGNTADAEPLSVVLSQYASELAGVERANVRAELGDVLRAHLGKHKDALSAYDAAIANDADNAIAWAGVRAVLDDQAAPAGDRQAAGRALLARAQSTNNHALHAATLQALYGLEQNLQARRALVAQLAGILVEELDSGDTALDLLLAHLEGDPDDDPVRRQAEAVAAGLARADDLFALYRRLRMSDNKETAVDYAARLAELSQNRGDLDGALEALRFHAELVPTDETPWRKMIELHERRNDAIGVAACLQHLADTAPAAHREQRLLELADYYGETLEDDQQALATLRRAHDDSPGDDGILARIEGRLRMTHKEGAELADVVHKRAALQSSPSQRAAMLAEHGALVLRAGDASQAVSSLLASLRVERDGQSTPRVTELLQKIAVRDDSDGIAALDAIIEHHREQKAWQPLVESLEIAAQKRPASEERARLFDDISDLNERALRVPQLAFMAVCRALRDAPSEERLARARQLAEATDSQSDLLEVCEDVAEAYGKTSELDTALRFLKEAAAIAVDLSDKGAQTRVAEATLRLDPQSQEALTVLEAITRADADERGLLDVLQRRAAQAHDDTAKIEALVEIARLTAGKDDAIAEQALGSVLDISPQHHIALHLLDELYERTGNSAAHVAVLERRVEGEEDRSSRAHLRARLGQLRLRRRGDPGGALDDLTAAVSEEPAAPSVRQGLEVLLEHARSRGAPPVGIVAELLERALRAQNDLSFVPAIIELRLAGASDPVERGALLVEIVKVQEQLGQPSLAFMAVCRAVKELPEDASLREEAERLAKATDSLEALAVVYEDVLDNVEDQQTKVLLHKRIATLAETVGGDADTARERMAAAVQAGATDTGTLTELARLTRETGSPEELAVVLLRLAEAAVLEADVDIARDAYGELADVDENLGDIDGAIHASKELLVIDAADRSTRSNLERLLARAERWPDLVELLGDASQRAQTPEEQANVLSRLMHTQLEKLKDFPGAITSLRALADVLPASEAITALGARALVMLSGDGRAEARQWRAAFATVMEPRYDAQGAWAELAPVIRLRLDVEENPEHRKALWQRVIDVEERLLNKPEMAMLSLSRALTEDPSDTALRERAERLSVRLHDLESLLGLYEDLIVRLQLDDPLRVVYASRCAELYEGGVGDPVRAAEMYETAFTAMTAQQGDVSERGKLLERAERLYRAVGDPQRLSGALKRRAELHAKENPAASRQQYFEAAAIEMHGLQDYGAAITTLKKLLEIQQDDLAALRALEEACEKQQRWPELTDTLERELAVVGESDPQRSLEARFKLGTILDTHLGLPDEALIQFQAILAVRPDHKETRDYMETRLVQRSTGRFDGASFLQQSYEKTGDWQKAIEVLQGQMPELERRGDKRELREHLTRIADLQEQQLNAPDLAFVTLCRALKHDPSDPALRARLKKIAIDTDVSDDLTEVLEDEALAAEVSGKSSLAAELREEAASIYADAMADIPRAIAAYEAVLEKNPGRLTPLESLSGLYAKVGRYDDVEKALRRRLMFKDEPQDRVELLVELGDVLSTHLGRPEEAMGFLDEVRRIEPQHTPARRLLIEISAEQGAWAELRSLLVEELDWCRINGDDAGLKRARARLANLLADKLDDVTTAIPLWEEERAAQETTTSTDDSFKTLERLYAKAEQWSPLRALYEEALKKERDPGQISTLTTKLGDVLSVHLGGQEEAISRHLKVLELDPQNLQSLDALRTLYPAVDKHEELVTLLRRMMRTTGDAKRLKDLRFQLAETLGGKLGKRAEAIDTGRRILDIEPHDAKELERLAGIFRACEAWEPLAEVLERLAVQLDGSARVLRLLEIADVFEKNLNRGRLAVTAYEKILVVEPKHERAYARLCDIHADNADWHKLIGLKEERVKALSDSLGRIGLLKEIGAIFDEKLGQKELAFLAACRAFREDYDSKELADWMDKLALETDSVDELVTIYDDALESLTSESRVLQTHLRMAELAWKHMSSPNDAEVHFKRVLEYDAKNDAALDGLVALYDSLDRHDDTVSIFERRLGQTLDVPGRVDWLRKIAKVLDQRARNVDGAIDAYRRITEIDGANAVAVKELAELLEREERWPALVNVLKRSEELAPTTEERLSIRYRTAGIWENQLGNPDQAIAVFRTVLDEDSSHTLALKALERLFTSQNRPEELLKIFERMAELAQSNDEYARLLNKIAGVYEESFDDLRSAAAAHERILQKDPQNVPAIKNLERLLRALGEWELLVQAYNLHTQLTRDPKEIVSLYLSMGEVYAKELSRTDKAEAMYNAALDFDPGSQDAIGALGSLYEKSGNWFNALEKLQQEAQLKGTSPEAVETYYRIGKINEEMLLDQGNAIVAYKAALHIEPSHLPSIKALKEIAAGKNEYQEQLKWFKAEAQYTNDDVERADVHTALGLFMQDALADLEGASQEFEKALAITYDHLPAAKPLADISFRDEHWSRAEQLLDIITERLDPNTDGPELCRQHYRLGYVCEKLTKEQKALKNYQRAYEIDSTYLPALEGLGASLSRSGRWDDASKIYQAILIHHRDGLTDAEIVDYYQQLADLNHKLVQSDRAIKNLEKALELDATHAPSLRLLATVYEGEQRFEDAYEAMVRLVPQVGGDERVNLLVELGRLAKSELDDPYRSIDAYEDANRQRPGDRDILNALLQLYRQTRQGPRAVEILEELVRVEPDEKQRVRLNQTLGEVWRDELKNDARAVQYFNAALDLDPTFVKAFESIEGALSTANNWPGLEEAYIAMLKRLPDADPRGIKGVLWKNLGDLYRFKLKNLAGATQAYMVLAKMQPNDTAVLEVLADLLSKNPQATDDAIMTWQRLVQLNPDRMQRPLHELVRLYLGKKLTDRAYLACSVLNAVKDAAPQEQQLLAAYQKQAQVQAKRAMTDKLWDLLLMHPDARGPLAQLSTILWRGAGSTLVRQPKDYDLDKKKFWEKRELDAPVPMYFVTQLKYVRGVLNVGNFELWEKLNGAEPLAPLALEVPTLAIGKGNLLLRDTNARALWFAIGRQVSGLRPAFILPRVLGATRFAALIDVTIKLVEPRYPVKADPREVQEVERALARVAQPLANAAAPIVQELLKTRQAVNTRGFLEAMEHTALRTGYLLTGDIEQAIMLSKVPDATSIPLAPAVKLKELLTFAVSEEHFELRQRLGVALG